MRASGLCAEQPGLTCVQFPDAFHGDSTNLPLWMEQLGVSTSPATGPVDKTQMQQALTALLVDFFECHLRGELSHLTEIAAHFAGQMQVL